MGRLKDLTQLSLAGLIPVSIVGGIVLLSDNSYLKNTNLNYQPNTENRSQLNFEEAISLDDSLTLLEIVNELKLKRPELYDFDFQEDSRYILVDKSSRKLRLYQGNLLIDTFPISLGTDPRSDKIKMGDRSTPEGIFYVAHKKVGKFGKALHINYPNIEDAKRGLSSELISKSEYDSILKTNEKCQIPPQNTDLGSYIELHGGGVGRDWTWGCIALRDKEMSEVYEFSTEGCDTNIIIYK
ncbi:L,D-transpeptidase [archaeon]|jgi:murein L,D-transpeptidase YafK|nr:L,D-transpeptidase [archaeon]MBT3451591.1 L,D-transpeptidase [archaeon]MBT6869611.1 L,D-transpeptidase [archaeon]MBT7192380.1 L,D-transpeptidase [archaeon]MBT7380181.1 L,D-transpeptidase [archaeon]